MCKGCTCKPGMFAFRLFQVPLLATRQRFYLEASRNVSTPKPLRNHRKEKDSYCGWAQVCTGLQPWKTIACWHLRGSHHSRVSWVLQNGFCGWNLETGFLGGAKWIPSTVRQWLKPRTPSSPARSARRASCPSPAHVCRRVPQELCVGCSQTIQFGHDYLTLWQSFISFASIFRD